MCGSVCCNMSATRYSYKVMSTSPSVSASYYIDLKCHCLWLVLSDCSNRGTLERVLFRIFLRYSQLELLNSVGTGYLVIKYNLCIRTKTGSLYSTRTMRTMYLVPWYNVYNCFINMVQRV